MPLQMPPQIRRVFNSLSFSFPFTQTTTTKSPEVQNPGVQLELFQKYPTPPGLIQGGRYRIQNTLQRLSQFTKPVRNKVTDTRRFISSRWYLRLLPLYGGLMFGLGKTAYDDHQLSLERAALSVAVDDDIKSQIMTAKAVSWQQGLNVIHQYPYDQELVRFLIPKLYEQTASPEGALVLSHILIETFSLSPALDEKTKYEYIELITNEFLTSLTTFRSRVETLIALGAINQPLGVYEIDGNCDGQADVVLIGYPEENLMGVRGFLQGIQKEHEQVGLALDQHEAWLGDKVNAQIKNVVSERKARFQTAQKLDWNDYQRKLISLDGYLMKSEQAYVLMLKDFDEKNIGIWKAYIDKSFDLDSMGSLSGMAAAGLSLQGSSGIGFIVKSIPFMYSGANVEGSLTAKSIATTRQPITFCIPGFGSLCEDLEESGIVSR